MNPERHALACELHDEERCRTHEEREAAIDERQHAVMLECGAVGAAADELAYDYCADTAELLAEIVYIVCRRYAGSLGRTDDAAIGKRVREKVEQLARARAAWEVDTSA